MYFFKKKGKQILDLRGDLILTHNKNLVMGRSKSAAPSYVRNAKHIDNIATMDVWRKIKASCHAVGFIFGENQALDQQDLNQTHFWEPL